jgi:hypothetical protein
MNEEGGYMYEFVFRHGEKRVLKTINAIDAIMSIPEFEWKYIQHFSKISK